MESNDNNSFLLSSSPPPLLKAINLCLKHQGRLLVPHINYTLNAGEILQITGPNGVGKTSLLRLTCGLIPMSEGELYWQGKPLIQGLAGVQAQFVYIGYKAGMKADLTVKELLEREILLNGRTPKEKIEKILKISNLKNKVNVNYRNLSAGQKQRLALTRLLLFPAKLWLLDEPYNHLDTAARRLLTDQLRNFLAIGGSVLIVSHRELTVDFPSLKTLSLNSNPNWA